MKTNSAAPEMKTFKDDRGVILSTDGLYWFQPVSGMHSQSKRAESYRVIRRADKALMIEGASSISVAARLLAAKLAAVAS